MQRGVKASEHNTRVDLSTVIEVQLDTHLKLVTVTVIDDHSGRSHTSRMERTQAAATALAAVRVCGQTRVAASQLHRTLNHQPNLRRHRQPSHHLRQPGGRESQFARSDTGPEPHTDRGERLVQIAPIVRGRERGQMRVETDDRRGAHEVTPDEQRPRNGQLQPVLNGASERSNGQQRPRNGRSTSTQRPGSDR